eukprot:3410115-Lingulodinium_polyedra.AAC.1
MLACALPRPAMALEERGRHAGLRVGRGAGVARGPHRRAARGAGGGDHGPHGTHVVRRDWRPED